MTHTLRILILGTLTLVANLALAQETFPGTDLPIKMPIAELPDDWQALKISELASSEMYDRVMYTATISNGDYFMGGPASSLITALAVSWTNGESVNLNGKQFLITYVLTPTSLNLLGMADMDFKADHYLTLKLVNPEMVVSVTAVPDYKASDLKESIKNLFENHEITPVQTSYKTQGLSNAKQMALGVIIYCADYDDNFPYVESTPALKEIVDPYVRNDSVFKSNNPNGKGLLYYNMALSGVIMNDVENLYEVPLVFDPTPFPDGTYLVAFADGHAKYLAEEEWQALQPIFKKRWKRHGKPIAYKPDGGS